MLFRSMLILLSPQAELVHRKTIRFLHCVVLTYLSGTPFLGKMIDTRLVYDMVQGEFE